MLAQQRRWPIRPCRHHPEAVMRVRMLAVIIAWSLAISGIHAQPQFRLYASIIDGNGSSPAAIQPSDIRVLENGVEAKVLKIEPVSFPMKLQLLVDNGIGLSSDNISHLRNGVRGLLEALPEGMEVTVVATAGRPRVLIRASTDRAAIMKSIALLAPDGSTGTFVEALKEATERIEKDKSDHVAVIVSFVTTAGDRNILDRDVENIFERLQSHPTIVHVVLLSLVGSRSAAGGGANQTDIGINVAKLTGGRFESIAAPTRLATLLPEIGGQVATANERQARQFRVTVARPAGASGPLKQVSMTAFGGLAVSSVSLDGRISN
jgi:hypothetical protein